MAIGLPSQVIPISDHMLLREIRNPISFSFTGKEKKGNQYKDEMLHAVRLWFKDGRGKRKFEKEVL